MFFNPVDFKRQKIGINIYKDDIVKSPVDKPSVVIPIIESIVEEIITVQSVEEIITVQSVEEIITVQSVVNILEDTVEVPIISEPKTISIMDIDVKEDNL